MRVGKDDVFAYCAIPPSVPRAEYPDAWYQGSVSFSDVFWKIDTATGAAFFLANPKEFGAGNIDAVNPFLSDDERYLFFTNKKICLCGCWSSDKPSGYCRVIMNKVNKVNK